jgi:hypothetical protein
VYKYDEIDFIQIWHNADNTYQLDVRRKNIDMFIQLLKLTKADVDNIIKIYEECAARYSAELVRLQEAKVREEARLHVNPKPIAAESGSTQSTKRDSTKIEGGSKKRKEIDLVL